MITEIITGLINIFGPISTANKENSLYKDDALRTISYALDETYIYYRDIEHGRLPNREKEAQLVKLWSAAAISLRHFDSNLAEMCDLKAEFWIDPDNYDFTKIKELGIDLNNLRQAYRKMLKPDAKFFRR